MVICKKGKGRGSSFILCHVQLKNAVLVCTYIQRLTCRSFSSQFMYHCFPFVLLLGLVKTYYYHQFKEFSNSFLEFLTFHAWKVRNWSYVIPIPDISCVKSRELILCYTNSVKNEELINSLKNANFTTMISQIFQNFVFTGPICKILTFLETAFKFVYS